MLKGLDALVAVVLDGGLAGGRGGLGSGLRSAAKSGNVAISVVGGEVVGEADGVVDGGRNGLWGMGGGVWQIGLLDATKGCGHGGALGSNAGHVGSSAMLGQARAKQATIEGGRA